MALLLVFFPQGAPGSKGPRGEKGESGSAVSISLEENNLYWLSMVASSCIKNINNIIM